jgi:photosystem II stability/assembly factor-like uncharacterized protein
MLLLTSAMASAQRPSPTARATSVLDSTRYSATAPDLRGLRWRLVGPNRGGRVVAAAGDPVDPLTFYFGSVDGGVWKSANGGGSWTNLTDGKSTIASVGAIAVAPSDRNVLYAGGGEGDLREDWTYGDGMWRSTDAGNTWTHIGLADAQQIARIVVDPKDPDRLWVAALGHAAGPNSTRGVYRSNDAGKNWQRVLFTDDSTGAVDVEIDPSNPRILYAAMWRMERQPWGFIAGAAHSGLWKSIDGGDTWTELTFNPGMPKNRIGRIGVSVSPANPQRVYAVIESPPEDSTGGLFLSDNAGASWRRMNGDQTWMVRPWYYSTVTADPTNENTVYAMNLATWKSIDAGKTFTRVRVPHGDTHGLWIDPQNSKRMISANDGGASVSYDGGATWSTEGNQPTGQFYHVITDDQFPYRIYGAQQDLNSISISSTGGEWYSVDGGESAYIAPKPGDPNTVLAGGYTGTITRFDKRTGAAKDVSPGLNNYDGWAASRVPYRFQWTFPILYSSHDPKVAYAAAQQVFRSTDDGNSWQIISPDLTLHDPATLGPVGGPVTYDMTGTEWYASIFALAESPLSAQVMWAGSDDGLVHLTRDGGKTWTNVTPRDMEHFTRVSIIDASPFDQGTAYLAGNRYQLDDFHAYMWKTTDYGRTWTRIDHGIPDGAFARTIRADPVRRGLLYAGTETGVWYSTNDGSSWEPLQMNLPRSSVRDLTIHGSDLIAATHGRAIWSLDDVEPLRELTPAVRQESMHLFRPDTVVRAEGVRGAVIDWWLPAASQSPATLEVLNAQGRVIRTFKSASAPSTPADTMPLTPRASRPLMDDTLSFPSSDSVITLRRGVNRLVWNLRYPGTRQPPNVVNDEGSTDGPTIVPGNYTLRFTVGSNTTTAPLVVRGDPRVGATQAGYDAQLALAVQVQDKTNEVTDAAARIVSLERQIDARVRDSKDQPYAARVSAAAALVRPRLEAIRDSLIEIHSHADEITLHYPIRFYNMLLSLAGMVQSGEGSITQQESQVYAQIAAGVDAQLAALRSVEGGDLTTFNTTLQQLNVPSIIGEPAPRVVP